MATSDRHSHSHSQRGASRARAPLRRAAPSLPLASCLAAVLTILAPCAHAGLGSAPMATPSGATVNALTGGPALRSAAQSASGAASQASASASWSVRQTTLASGTVVREYVSADGTVFGVGWNGQQLPDLAALLGSYFPQYVAGVKANREAGRGRASGMVQGSGLVVHSGGHMGAFSGQAWLPQALPAGVSSSDIQ